MNEWELDALGSEDSLQCLLDSFVERGSRCRRRSPPRSVAMMSPSTRRRLQDQPSGERCQYGQPLRSQLPALVQSRVDHGAVDTPQLTDAFSLTTMMSAGTSMPRSVQSRRTDSSIASSTDGSITRKSRSLCRQASPRAWDPNRITRVSGGAARSKRRPASCMTASSNMGQLYRGRRR